MEFALCSSVMAETATPLNIPTANPCSTLASRSMDSPFANRKHREPDKVAAIPQSRIRTGPIRSDTCPNNTMEGITTSA
ncbi:hypothetical protein D3C73_1373760 [compost metagenome]